MLRRISFIFLLLFSLTAFADGVAGLTYYTYQGTSGPSPSISPLAYPTVRSTGTSASINYPAGSFGATILGSGIADRVIVKWVGYINIPTTGTYYFGANADDGFKILIDGALVTDSWIDAGGGFRSGAGVALTAGAHALTFWYYENGGGQMVIFKYSTDNITWAVVPTTMLATDSTYFAPPAPTYSSNITAAQTATRTAAQITRDSYSGNNIYIDQVGDNNTISILQYGNNNTIKGYLQQDSQFTGSNNIVDLRQGAPGVIGKNLIELDFNGNFNNIKVYQDRADDGSADGLAAGNHIAKVKVSGNSNILNTRQRNNNGPDGHFINIDVSGNSNNISTLQINDQSKTSFVNVNGSSNTVDLYQEGVASYYADIKLQGNGHNVTLYQTGQAEHKATIDLTNNGAAGTVNVTQQGTTAQIYSIQQSCVSLPCGATITQGQ